MRCDISCGPRRQPHSTEHSTGFHGCIKKQGEYKPVDARGFNVRKQQRKFDLFGQKYLKLLTQLPIISTFLDVEIILK